MPVWMELRTEWTFYLEPVAAEPDRHHWLSVHVGFHGELLMLLRVVVSHCWLSHEHLKALQALSSHVHDVAEPGLSWCVLVALVMLQIENGYYLPIC